MKLTIVWWQSADKYDNFDFLIVTPQCFSFSHGVFFQWFNALRKKKTQWSTMKHHVKVVTHYIEVVNFRIKIMFELPKNMIALLKCNFNNSLNNLWVINLNNILCALLVVSLQWYFTKIKKGKQDSIVKIKFLQQILY